MPDNTATFFRLRSYVAGRHSTHAMTFYSTDVRFTPGKMFSIDSAEATIKATIWKNPSKIYRSETMNYPAFPNANFPMDAYATEVFARLQLFKIRSNVVLFSKAENVRTNNPQIIPSFAMAYAAMSRSAPRQLFRMFKIASVLVCKSVS